MTNRSAPAIQQAGERPGRCGLISSGALRCGGIKLVGREYGELKRMYVRPHYRGAGFGELIVNRLADHARAHGVPPLRLETGVHQQAAIRLYERMGFVRIPPFGPYTNDPLSLCYEKRLAGPGSKLAGAV